MFPLCVCSRSAFGLFFFNDTATTEIYTLSLHDALPISPDAAGNGSTSTTSSRPTPARTSTSLSAPAARGRSEEHTSELQSLAYLVCRLLLEKKKAPIYLPVHVVETIASNHKL